MHEAERMIKSQEMISKNLKIDNLQNYVYESFFRPRENTDGVSCYHDTLEAIGSYFGFCRAIVIRARGRFFEPFYQWHEPGLSEFPLHLLEHDSLGALYRLCPNYSSVKHINSDDFPLKTPDNFGIKDCYVFPVEHKERCIGIICLMQDESRPLLHQDELNSLSRILSAIGSYMVTRHLEQRMRETTESLHMVLNNLKDTVYVVDQNTYEVVFANANFDGKNIVGSRGVACFRLKGRDTTCSCCGLDMIRNMPEGSSYSFETNERETGFWHSVTTTSMEWLGGRKVFLNSVRDITEEKLRQEEFIEAATFDLTFNIPNIGRLTMRLDKLLGSKKANGYLFIIDINNYKLINNAYGHDYGDALLEDFIVFLKSSMPRGEFVYRYATRTFAVLYEGADKDQAEAFVELLKKRFVKPWRIKDKICYATFSTAIIPYSAEDKTAAGVMRNADIAHDKAIDRNRNSFFTFDRNKIDDNYSERVELVNDMHALIENDFVGFHAHYQPVFDVIENKALYVEALMRWNHPEKGFIPPLKFISLAEGASLIAPLSERLIDMAVAQCKQWQKTNPSLRLCVNFSIVHSYQEGVVERISEILKKYDFAPQDLIIEINEKDTISDQPSLFDFMRRLQQLGCGVALDDFGSGMSSMSQMRSFPVDFIKIDRCVVDNICESEYDRAIISFLANLPLDVHMVCEGIETKEQLDTVKSLGIKICQGYYLSRPLPPEELSF
jgi:diguanylate cyclase (GGDEF)-like protein